MKNVLWYSALFGGVIWGARLVGQWLARGMLAAVRYLRSKHGG